MLTLGRYSSCRPSHRGKLGTIPSHWRAESLGRLGHLSKGKGGSKQDAAPWGVRCVRYGDIYTRYQGFIWKVTSYIEPSATSRYTPIRRGDVLFAASGESINEIGRSAVNLSSEPVVCGGDIIVFRPTAKMDPVFLGYACNAHPIAHQKSSMGRGFTVVHVYADELKQLVLPVPPLGEQVTIGAVLTEIDQRINRLVASKRRLIGRLEEQKQAIIHRAVTRGLDAHVRLKPSGIDWLGEVPAHWEVGPLRRRCGVMDCKHVTVPFVDDGIPLASVREVKGFELCLNNAKMTTEPWYRHLVAGERCPAVGDIIYCRNVGVGAAALVTTEERFAMGQDVCLIRTRREDGRFLNYFLRSLAMKHQLSQLLIGSTFNRINVSDIKVLRLLYPPAEEQRAIARHLDEAVSGLDRSRESAEREIALLREYRTRLITDVVTGKLDVRGVSLPPLPDEPDAPPDPDDAEPLDDPELMDAAEAMAERAAGDALT